MRAIIKASEEPGSLQVADMPQPKPGLGQVLVQIKATNICNTDASILHNKYVGRKPVPIPMILGHEGAGIVTEIGPEVQSLGVGDHVALEPITGCGLCDHCKRGFQNMCQSWNHIGITEHGTFAEYIVVEARKAHKLTKTLGFAEAACAEPLGLVARTLEQTKPVVGETAVIIGPGSLGLMHLLALKAAGASKVIMVGLDQDGKRFEIAGSLGADNIINLSKVEPNEAILEFTNGKGADIVVETANSPKAAELSFTLAATHGRVSLFGLYPSANFSPLQLTRKALKVYGDVGQITHHFMRSVFWLNSGIIDVSELVKNRFSLDQAEEAFEAARRGNVPKVVFEP